MSNYVRTDFISYNLLVFYIVVEIRARGMYLIFLPSKNDVIYFSTKNNRCFFIHKTMILIIILQKKWCKLWVNACAKESKFVPKKVYMGTRGEYRILLVQISVKLFSFYQKIGHHPLSSNLRILLSGTFVEIRQV